jgi:hypothetical protein
VTVPMTSLNIHVGRRWIHRQVLGASRAPVVDPAGAPHPPVAHRGEDESPDRRTALPRRKTVKNYVTSMLSKLAMQRRTQVALLASKLPN